MSKTKLDALKDDLAARKTKVFLVIRNDKIVYEWYAPDHGVSIKHGTASLAKAIVGGLSLGVALSDRLIALDDKAAKFVPDGKMIRASRRSPSDISARTLPDWMTPRPTIFRTNN